MRSRQADEYRSLEEEFRQQHQKMREKHEQEIQCCIRQYFAKSNQDQPEDLSLHRTSTDIAQASAGLMSNVKSMATHPANQLFGGASQPMVTLASNNFLMPPVPTQQSSSHSSTEDCSSGCSYEVKHKLHVSSQF